MVLIAWLSTGVEVLPPWKERLALIGKSLAGNGRGAKQELGERRSGAEQRGRAVPRAVKRMQTLGAGPRRPSGRFGAREADWRYGLVRYDHGPPQACWEQAVAGMADGIVQSSLEQAPGSRAAEAQRSPMRGLCAGAGNLGNRRGRPAPRDRAVAPAIVVRHESRAGVNRGARKGGQQRGPRQYQTNNHRPLHALRLAQTRLYLGPRP